MWFFKPKKAVSLLIIFYALVTYAETPPVLPSTPSTPSIVSELQQEAVTNKLTELRHLIYYAIEHNPDIRAAYEQWVAEKYTIPQASALPDPAVTAGYIELIGNDLLEEPLQGLQNIGLVQAIPFPGKLYFRGKIAGINAKRADAEHRATSFTIISELKRKYYQLYFINQSTNIYQANKKTLEDMMRLAETRQVQGKASEQDALLAETEIARIDMQLIILVQEHESVTADINNLLNRKLDIPIKTPTHLVVTPLNYNSDQLNDLIKVGSPELTVRKREVEKGRANIKLSQMDYFSDIELEADKLRDIKLNADGYQVALKASFPLYFMNKQSKAVKESVARYNVSIEDFQLAYQSLGFRVRNAFLIIQRSNQLIRLLEHTIIPKARETFMASKKSYLDSQVDFLTFFNNLATLQKSELEFEAELVRREKNITQIEEVIGLFL